MLRGYLRGLRGVDREAVQQVIKRYKTQNVQFQDNRENDYLEVSVTSNEPNAVAYLETMWEKEFPDSNFQVEEHCFMFDPVAKEHFLRARESYYMDGPPWY